MISVLKEEMQKKVVFIYTDSSSNSSGHGVFISRSGLILTAYHIFSSDSYSVGSKVIVKCSDQTICRALIRAIEERFDLTLLQVESIDGGEAKLKFKYGVIGEEIRIGQEIHMVTSTDDRHFIYSRGIVGFERRMCDEITHRDDISFIDDKTYFVQGHGLHGVPGSSGAPVFDSWGHIIGIYSNSYGRMDLLVHMNLLREFCKDFMEQREAVEVVRKEKRKKRKLADTLEEIEPHGETSNKGKRQKQKKRSRKHVNADEVESQTDESEAKQKKKKNRKKAMLIGKLSFKLTYQKLNGRRKIT